MKTTTKPVWTPHLLRVRTPEGDVHEVDLQPICQPRLAVRFAYKLAAFLSEPAGMCTDGPAWAHAIHADLCDLGVEPSDCAVEIVRRARDVDYFDTVGCEYLSAPEPGAVNGWVPVLSVPVGPAAVAGRVAVAA